MQRFAVNGGLERTFETAVTMTDANGRFTFAGVPPGDFVIKAWRFQSALVIAQTPLPAEPTLWAEQPVAVGPAGVRDLSVPLNAGLTIGGRIQFEGAAQKPTAVTLQTPLSVAFEPPWPLAFGARMATRVTPAFEFATQPLPPGRYFATLSNNFTPRGWYFESATLQGRDLLITPLVLDAQSVTGVVITFSDRRSELSGTIRDLGGRPDPAASVVVFPADYRAWLQAGAFPLAARVEPVSQTGVYALPLRPGDYLVAAVRDDSARAVAATGGGRRDRRPRHARHDRARRRQTTRSRETVTAMRTLLAATCCLAGAVAMATAQAPRTASIAGVILADDAEGRPIARAAVTLTGAGVRPSVVAITDAQGRFAFDGLPAGQFTVSAAKPGYLTMAYGQATPGRGSGLPIALRDERARAGVVVEAAARRRRERTHSRRARPADARRVDRPDGVPHRQRRAWHWRRRAAADGCRRIATAPIASATCCRATIWCRRFRLASTSTSPSPGCRTSRRRATRRRRKWRGPRSR